MKGKRLIRSLELRNFLSFGNEDEAIELQPLNVLIGPNASGKSNLIEAIGLLHAAPHDLAAAIREGGGVDDWLWKGAAESPVAELEVVVDYPEGFRPLLHRMCFTMVGQRMELVDEVVEDAQGRVPSARDPDFYYRYQGGRPVINIREIIEEVHLPGEPRSLQKLRWDDLKPDQSVLSQKIDRHFYPEITYLGEEYRRFYLFRELQLGRRVEPRRAQRTDLPGDFLLEDASNLGLVLNDLQHRGLKPQIMEFLRKFYYAADDLTVKIYGGTAQLYLHEKGLARPIPAPRLSDGTIRFLCLIAMLCHPSPPPLLCIEEPELGLHPDIMPTIGEMLIDASERTQLIVTTHSAPLISALSEIPEAVMVCERDESGSHLARLESGPLEKWLEKYSLGDLWLKGEIGGTRW
jgi:predicted ATPase